MPRLTPSLIRRAGRISRHLATLLPACRTIGSAQNELRWIREHVLDSSRSKPVSQGSAPYNGAECQVSRKFGKRSSANRKAVESRIARLVARRGLGEPLQYVLGTQPFGDLEILCEKGVLIPRPETEAWASTLADLVFSSPVFRDTHHRPVNGGVEVQEANEEAEGLRILDLCSGTGCIGLSLYARWINLTRGNIKREEATYRQPRVFGFDVEARAVRLARRNVVHNAAHLTHNKNDSTPNYKALEDAIIFQKADIFSDKWMAHLDAAGPLPCKQDPAQTTTSKEKHITTITIKGGESTPRKPAHNQKQDKRANADTETYKDKTRKIDVLVSNPPYISQRGFESDTGRSVRNHEPKIALVPPPRASSSPTTESATAPEDIFYARLLDIADALRPRAAVFEVGDMAQAKRVVDMAIARSVVSQPSCPEGTPERGPRNRCGPRWEIVEIWRDWPDCQPLDDEADSTHVSGREIPLRGSGHGRVVFLAEGRDSRLGNRGFRHEIYTSQ